MVRVSNISMIGHEQAQNTSKLYGCVARLLCPSTIIELVPASKLN